MLGLIPAAGKGTRFLELGKHYPKCILPYKEVPIIVHNIRKLIEYGCDEVLIGVSHRGDMVGEVVNRYFDSEVVRVIDVGSSNSMPETLQTMLVDKTENFHHDDVMIILGDIIADGDLTIPVNRTSWVSVKWVEDYSRWCMAEYEPDFKLKKLIDKPTERPDTKLALSGIYYFSCLDTFTDCNQYACNRHDNFLDGEQQLSKTIELFDDSHEAIQLIDQNVIDLGTYEEYIDNRGLSTSREFNSIEKDGSIVRKFSLDTEKMRSEYHWFKDLPTDIKPFAPNVYELDLYFTRSGYSMEFVTKPTLRELFLYTDSSTETWELIFGDIWNLQDKMSFHSTHGRGFIQQMITKTRTRCDAMSVSIENHVRYNDMMKILDELYNSTECGRYDSLAHGDFCLSNIMWSATGIRMIDPRGEYYGSIYYEMAKLCHSIIGHYDFIDAELYTVHDDDINIYDGGKENVEQLFLTQLAGRFNKHELVFIKMICASLFISMIPLHYHNKTNQMLFMNKFEEIYDEAKESYNRL